MSMILGGDSPGRTTAGVGGAGVGGSQALPQTITNSIHSRRSTKKASSKYVTARRGIFTAVADKTRELVPGADETGATVFLCTGDRNYKF